MPYHRAHHRQVYHKVRALPRMVSLGFFKSCVRKIRELLPCVLIVGTLVSFVYPNT